MFEDCLPGRHPAGSKDAQGACKCQSPSPEAKPGEDFGQVAIKVKIAQPMLNDLICGEGGSPTTVGNYMNASLYLSTITDSCGLFKIATSLHIPEE